MNDQLSQTSEGFPCFLQDYGKLLSHFQAEFESLSSKQKGDYFADFAQRLVPHSEIGRSFERPQKSPKETYDEGVDLSCGSKDGTQVLYIQAKYGISGVDDMDLIMSKFRSYQQKGSTELQPRLIPDSDEEQPPVSHFMIVTAQDLHTRTLPRYKKSKRESAQFYKMLESEGRIHVIDGPQVLRLLREVYRKSYMLPSRVCLSLAKPFINLGNVYIGIIGAGEVMRLYDEFGDALFLENIREYLGPTSGKVKSGRERITVNEAIANTLAQAPDQFLARNNGITLRARSVDIRDEATLILNDASVVNGCQTTMSIVQNPQENCFVMVKIVEALDSWDIAEAANFQNQIDQIALKLARYIRPQMIRAAASEFSVRFEGPGESSPFAVIDSIYQEEITEEEFRALFLGLFSSSPRNVLSVNYTEVNVDVINKLYGGDNQERETVEETLFKINWLTRKSAKEVEDALRYDAALLDLFQRFWKEDKPSYRAFLAILAASGCAKVDVYSKVGHPTYEDMISYLSSVQDVIDRNPEVFVRYYQLAFTSVALEAIKGNQNREEILQQMKATIESSNFANLYLKLQVLAATDHWLKEKQGAN
jgi:hypothetical protein